jgi:hypothetical protein
MAPDVSLNPADCSLDCQLQGHLASTLSDEGFGYLWSGGYTSAIVVCAATMASKGSAAPDDICSVAASAAECVAARIEVAADWTAVAGKPACWDVRHHSRVPPHLSFAGCQLNLAYN